MLPAGRIRAPRLRRPGQGRDTQGGGGGLRSAVEFRQVSRNPFVTGAVEPPFPTYHRRWLASRTGPPFPYLRWSVRRQGGGAAWTGRPAAISRPESGPKPPRVKPPRRRPERPPGRPAAARSPRRTPRSPDAR